MREDVVTPLSPGARRVKLVSLALVLCVLPCAPSRAQTGADFTTYVAVGDGFTAGFQDGALHADAQRRAYPALVAAAAATDAVLPLVAEPGFPSPNSVTGLGLKIQRAGTCEYGAFDLAAGASTGRVDVTAKATNVAVPYERIGDALALRWRANLDETNAATFEDVVLGYPYALTGELPPSTQVETAVALRPTFVTVWLGVSDALGAAVAGEVDSGTLTPTGQFAQRVDAVFDALATTGAKGAVLNVPDPTTFAALVSARELRQRTGLSAKQMRKKLGVAKSSYVTLTSLPTVDAIAAGDAQGPLADSQILTSDELGRIGDAVAAYNAALAKKAKALGWALVDVNALYAGFARRGVDVGGVGTLTTDYLGGLSDLDGIYPSDTAHALLALAVVSAINEKYGTTLPLPNVATVAATDPHTCGADTLTARRIPRR